MDGFYFDEISKIIENQGAMSKLVEIPEADQISYLKILRQFEN